MTKCNDACYCRNLIFGITFLTIGIVLLVAGGVIAAVGFGTWPKDMFDQRNLGMRVAGLIMAGSGFLPIIMGIMFIVFYCGFKSGKYPGRKKAPNDIELSAISGRKAPLNEYPYPSASSGPIYKPGLTANDSLMKYEDLGNNDSFTVPLSTSGRLSANDGLHSSNVYGEVRETEQGGTVTKTSTATRVYKTTTLEDNRNSGSSSGGPNSTEMVQVKPKRPKKHDTSGSGSSEPPPFNEGDAKLLQKSKRAKKNQKKGSFDEVFDDGEEPLPGGQHRSSGSDTVDGQNWVKKTQHTTTSYEVRTTTSSNPVYGKVNKKRENMI